MVEEEIQEIQDDELIELYHLIEAHIKYLKEHIIDLSIDGGDFIDE